MKIKTSELTGAALDWAVAEAEGNVQLQYDSREGLIIRNILGWIPYRPSVAWQQGGPIIEREKISIMEECNGTWMGSIGGCTDLDMPLWQEHGPTPLIAAMRCYVVSKLGDTVDIPEELK
jgi:hypothetical protein